MSSKDMSGTLKKLLGPAAVAVAGVCVGGRATCNLKGVRRGSCAEGRGKRVGGEGGGGGVEELGVVNVDDCCYLPDRGAFFYPLCKTALPFRPEAPADNRP